MSLVDEFLSSILPPRKPANLCIDEVAKDLGRDKTGFREEARRSLFIPGQPDAVDIDKAFMESVRTKLISTEGKQDAESSMSKYQRERDCQ
jgi:hypothetical protein